MRTSCPAVSKAVMGPMPLRAASRPDQFAAVPTPSGVTSPRPVTTTRRGRYRKVLLQVLLDVVDGVLDRADVLRLFVRDLDVEDLFHRHHELDDVQGVGPQV